MQMVEKEKHDYVRDILDECVSDYDITYHKDGTDVIVYTHGDEYLCERMTDWLPDRVPDEFSVTINSNQKNVNSHPTYGDLQKVLDTVCTDYEIKVSTENMHIDITIYEWGVNIPKEELNKVRPTAMTMDVEVVGPRRDALRNNLRKEEVNGYTIYFVSQDDFDEYVDWINEHEIICREFADGKKYYYKDGIDFYARNSRAAVDHIESFSDRGKFSDKKMDYVKGYSIITVDEDMFFDMMNKIKGNAILCRKLDDGNNHYYHDGYEFYSRNHESAVDYVKNDSRRPSDDSGVTLEGDEDIWSELPADKRVMWTSKYQEQGYIMATITDVSDDRDTVTYTYELPWGDTVEHSLNLSTFESTGSLARFTEQHGYDEDQYKSLVNEEVKMRYSNGSWAAKMDSSGEEFKDDEVLSGTYDTSKSSNGSVIWFTILFTSTVLTYIGIVSIPMGVLMFLWIIYTFRYI